jgi:hypothetical protein
MYENYRHMECVHRLYKQCFESTRVMYLNYQHVDSVQQVRKIVAQERRWYIRNLPTCAQVALTI